MSQPNLPRCRRARRRLQVLASCRRLRPSLRRNIGKNLTPSLHRRGHRIRRDPSAASASNLCNDSKLQTSPRRITGAPKSRVMTSGAACAQPSASAVKFDRPAKWLKFARDQTGTRAQRGGGEINKKKSRRFFVAYHFDPASRGSEESQNNSCRTSSPLAMKTAAEMSHFSSFYLILSPFSPPPTPVLP